ncbi:unnamed protein product, partial [Mesorhabditis spiculigera]
MGAYLSSPRIGKTTTQGQGNGLVYVATTMQGWRSNQEDAHNTIIDLLGDYSMFAVYDGHGGDQVARYAERHFPDFLRRFNWDDREDISTTNSMLVDIFLAFDDHLRQPETLAAMSRPPGVQRVEAELNQVVEEQNLPISDVLARYGMAMEEARNSGEVVPMEKLVETVSATVASFMAGRKRRHSGDDPSSSKRLRGPLPQLSVDLEDEPGPSGSGGDDKKDEKSDDVEKKDEKGDAVEKVAPGGSGDHAGDDDDDDDESDEDFVLDEPSGENEALAAGDDDDDEGVVDDEDEDEDEDEEEADEEGIEVIDEEDEEEPDEDRASNFFARAQQNKPGIDSGATACVALVNPKRVIVANIGDTRAVVSLGGIGVDLSVDHKPEDELERARIERAGAHVTEEGRVNGGLNLSRAFGDFFYKRNSNLPLGEQAISALPEIQVHDRTPDDEFLVVACDGIWNSKTSQEVVDFVKEGLAAKLTDKEIVEALCNECLAPNTSGDGTGCDNMTVILVWLRDRDTIGPAVKSPATASGEVSITSSAVDLQAAGDMPQPTPEAAKPEAAAEAPAAAAEAEPKDAPKNE